MPLAFPWPHGVLPSTVQLCPEGQSHCLEVGYILDLAGGGQFDFHPQTPPRSCRMSRGGDWNSAILKAPQGDGNIWRTVTCDDCQ